jgi:hypothetical protein
VAQAQRSRVEVALTKWIKHIFVAFVCVVVACYLLWRVVLWLDAVSYVSWFQQTLDEQCPNSGIVVSLDQYSNNPYHHWNDDKASCYLDPNTHKPICSCPTNP